jgi:hypothetical protein
LWDRSIDHLDRNDYFDQTHRKHCDPIDPKRRGHRLEEFDVVGSHNFSSGILAPVLRLWI